MGSPTAQTITRRAFLVGINSYEPPAANAPQGAPDSANAVPGSTPQSGPPDSARGWQNLSGAEADADAMAQLLTRRFDFPANQVTVLKGRQATRDAILAGFRQQLVAAAAAGDLCVFFYAGHGSQMRNSGSSEPDGLDETLVPADSYLGTPDIRDKELESLFNDVLDRGARLDVILDSCHSTSIQRGAPLPGTVRAIGPDWRDAASLGGPARRDERGDPAERGALVLAAAQDDQRAVETLDPIDGAHGYFTRSLLEVLRGTPRDEPAERVFARLRARMSVDGTRQDPSLAGTTGRRRAALFGFAAGDTPGRFGVTVLSKSQDECVVEGGLAVGLYPGSRLRRIAAGADRQSAGAVRVEVQSTLGVNQAKAQIIEGGWADLDVGDFLEVELWAAPRRPLLRVHVPAGSPPANEFTQAGRRNVPPGTHRAGPGPARVPRVLANAVASGLRSLGGVVEATADSASAQYVLTERSRGTQHQYAWVRCAAASDSGLAASPLPAQTDWLAGTNLEAAAASLVDQARGLVRVRGWHELEAPPDNGRFPYRLALRSRTTSEFVQERGCVTRGDRVDLVLVADTAVLTRPIERRYVYVFVIDSDGQISVLYPRTGGNIENLLPPRVAEGAPAEIALRPFLVVPPFGLDTYVMLSTAEPLVSTSVLEGVPVTARDDTDALSKLLSTVAGGPARGVQRTPVQWSIQRQTIRSLSGGVLPASRR